jgi:hypothetical protein
MPHPEVRNRTLFSYASLLAADKNATPHFVALLQGSYTIAPSGKISLLEEQTAPVLGGEWYGDPATSSMRLEPQIAFAKQSTDIVMLGAAHAPQPGTNRMQVGIRVGHIQKLAIVTGTRRLLSSAAGVRITEPEPFDSIPLVYERAFGGWDRRAENPEEHRCEVRNPVGMGYRDSSRDTDSEVLLPNIEDPQTPIGYYGQTPLPAGFGFIAPNWQPRLALAGTYDEVWDQQRKPLLPVDFDEKFFNAASPGLIAPTYLRGDEAVTVIGAAPQGRVAFNLPGQPPPACRVEMRGRNHIQLQTQLDTLIVDMDKFVLTLQWRAHLAVRNGFDDIIAVELFPSASV